MRDTYLVQRLTKKPTSDAQAKLTQVLGGEMLLLSQEGWKILQGIFDIDYMGAAEFEFGALPRCLQGLAQDTEALKTFELVIPRSKIKPHFYREVEHSNKRREEIRKAKAEGRKPPRAKKPKVRDAGGWDVPVYVICRKDHEAGVRQAILDLAGGKLSLKEWSGFDRALDPMTEYDRTYIGWLELDNGFFWFLDHEAYAKTAELFNLQPVPKENRK